MKGEQRTIEHLVSTLIFSQMNSGNVFIVVTMTTRKLVEETITVPTANVTELHGRFGLDDSFTEQNYHCWKMHFCFEYTKM